MKRNGSLALVLLGIAVCWTFPRLSSPVFGQAAPSEAPHIGEGGLPQFARDPNFPKVPSKWRMGFGSDVAVDAKDHIWVLSRPHSLRHPRSTPPDLVSVPAPPVMEFDNEGNFIQAWGGESGPGYQWPSNEHGISVDEKGFVWIVGNADGARNNPANLPNDNQVLKFTREGKFVMAIGKSGQTGSNATEVLKGATSARFYAKTNEVFVTDGYGNSRVMVYDADTGAFKRMWGAYGNKPLDMDQRPVEPESKPNELCPMVCGIWSVFQQFSVPHDIKFSNDGLAYIADRGNKRVQVFTPEGKFVAEQFIAIDSKYPLQARSVAFSPDPAQRFLYVAGAPDIFILNRRTLEILGSFNIGTPQGDPPGHLINADREGNVYAVQAELSGADGHGGAGAYKFTFKGYSPRVACPPCESTKRPQ
jgi:NHL repeat